MPTYRLLVRETTYTNYTTTSPSPEAAAKAVMAGVYEDSELMESDIEEVVSCEER